MDEGIILEIKQRALLLYVDNPRNYANLASVEAAVTIGASIVAERCGVDLIPGEVDDREDGIMARQWNKIRRK